MNDLRTTTEPKSDQLNSDDLIGRDLTIMVTTVHILGAQDQPVAINFEGDNGKPYKPCKSMRRVMIAAWGPDGSKYTGRRMTLYRDPEVQFGGEKVGGIRISHMSDIKADMTIALTATRGKRKPFVVKKLRDEAPAPAATKPAPTEDRAAALADKMIASIRGAADEAALRMITAHANVIKYRGEFAQHRPELAERVNAAVSEMLDKFVGPDPFADAGTSDPADDFPGVVSPREAA